ncbi:conserved protein of unknown function [Nitrospira japonica]|uniref:3-keto-alpha-glucoside-1,2-lyase/3-keto-2-hydroxy-glucal hydratase domain-containing protein n=1 Tax=Nitrospira japonica TaxID=1325564 RepID=A0A1W1I9C9_9BACT|nr:DUF1080 domain-containing protein [Nitrospira japonica]SLM49648.1 conserved protein of unknown function [Nitrospira japonica]
MIRLLGIGVLGVACVIAELLSPIRVPAAPTQTSSSVDFTGRWDLTTRGANGLSSAWLEIDATTADKIQGRLVWLYGGADPIYDIIIDDRTVTFHHSGTGEHLIFTARLVDDRLEGVASGARSQVQWTGIRAPDLHASGQSDWEYPRSLMNGRDLSGWVPRSGRDPRCWRVEKEILFNESPCTDLVSELRFSDFQLHVEFQLRDGGGSGVYLRGRYEVQIGNDAGMPATSRTTGAIFGQLSPSSSEAKPLGEWQALDVTIVGRNVTVAVNGRRVISESDIPGITGAALDSHEELPGPIMLQGDHGRVAFRNILLTPAR